MNKQSGNIFLWLVLGVVAVGLGAVIVWRYFAATESIDTAQQAEQTKTTQEAQVTKAVSVKESQIPKGWAVQDDSADVVMVGNGGMGQDEADNICFVQIVKQTDTKAIGADDYAELLYNNMISTINTNKGYTATHLGTINLAVQQNQQTVPVVAHTDKLTPPENGTPMYQRNGYIVNPKNGHYFAVTQSCSQNDFTVADEALKAFSIGS